MDSELSDIQASRNRRRRRRYRINLSRHVYNEQEFTESFIKQEEYVSSSEFEPSSLAKTFKRHFFPTRCTCKNVLQSWFPIVEWLPGYNIRRDLAHDMAGGLTVAIMHIPQGKKKDRQSLYTSVWNISVTMTEKWKVKPGDNISICCYPNFEGGTLNQCAVTWVMQW